MSKNISVQNESGQVVSFATTGDHDPRAQILEQRIARGELKKAGSDAKSEQRPRRGREVVNDADTGVKDERGDWLKSVHGGGLDPDADGDVTGQPSGSKKVDGATDTDAVSVAAVAQAEQRPQSEPAAAAAKARRGGK